MASNRTLLTPRGGAPKSTGPHLWGVQTALRAALPPDQALRLLKSTASPADNARSGKDEPVQSTLSSTDPFAEWTIDRGRPVRGARQRSREPRAAYLRSLQIGPCPADRVGS